MITGTTTRTEIIIMGTAMIIATIIAMSTRTTTMGTIITTKLPPVWAGPAP
jgi:hypothetical protein